MAPSPTAPPLLHLHRSTLTACSKAKAREYIQSYLSHATANAYLHPDAILSTNGVEFSSHKYEGGLVLQLLRRVEMGMGAKSELGADDTDELDLDGLTRETSRKRKREMEAQERQGWEDAAGQGVQATIGADVEDDDDNDHGVRVRVRQRDAEIQSPAVAVATQVDAERAAKRARRDARNRGQSPSSVEESSGG